MPRIEKVTRVIDGDTFETNRRKHPVRLANVNTPEKGTRGFQSTKQFLQAMIEGKEVSIETVARDKYSRSVADVRIRRQSVNKAVKKQMR